jgi:Holliday junction resolvase
MVHRQRKRTDANHVLIKNALIESGFSVFDLKDVGGGLPDLLVSKSKKTVLVEVKTATGQLNPLQIEFKRNWQGDIYVLRSVEDVFYMSGAFK